LWEILVRSRFYPVLLTGDIEKAFLQVRIKAEDRDALRFFWESPGSEKLTVYRFTRALFGLTCSPFLLGGVINEHLKLWQDKYPELFVSNRVRKIRDHSNKQWHYVPTEENPADIGSLGGSTVNNELWTNGPEWLSDPETWPKSAIIESSPETNAEAKVTKSILATAITRDDDRMDKLLEAHGLRKVTRIGARVRRFVNNSKCPISERETGPLKTAEIQDQYLW
jgi:hypothetical protein